MALVTSKVFIDTQVFIKLGFNFDNALLEEFRLLCVEEKLEHITTTIVKQEVESNLRNQMSLAHASLNKFKRHAQLLKKAGDEKTRKIFSDIDQLSQEELKKKAICVYKEFLDSTKAIVLRMSNIDPEEIFAQYFNKDAPFGDGKKKDEFPDAFILAALDSSTKGDDSKIYVVSGDGDMTNGCKSYDSLISISSLDALLQIYNECQYELVKLVENFVKNSADKIKILLVDQMEKSGADVEYYEEGFVEAVTSFEILGVDTLNPKVISLDNKDSRVYVEYDFCYEVEFILEKSVESVLELEERGVNLIGAEPLIEAITCSHRGRSSCSAEINVVYKHIDGELKSAEIKAIELSYPFGVPLEIGYNM